MLPPKIASEICSLTPGQERLTVSVVLQVSAHTGAVYEDETWIGKSIIKSAGKLSFKEVDAILSGHTDIKIEGAEIQDVKILHVGYKLIPPLLSLTHYRPLHRSLGNNDLGRTEKPSPHSDSSINWMMRMSQLNTTFSILLQVMSLLRS